MFKYERINPYWVYPAVMNDKAIITQILFDIKENYGQIYYSYIAKDASGTEMKNRLEGLIKRMIQEGTLRETEINKSRELAITKKGILFTETGYLPVKLGGHTYNGIILRNNAIQLIGAIIVMVLIYKGLRAK